MKKKEKWETKKIFRLHFSYEVFQIGLGLEIFVCSMEHYTPVQLTSLVAIITLYGLQVDDVSRVFALRH